MEPMGSEPAEFDEPAVEFPPLPSLDQRIAFATYEYQKAALARDREREFLYLNYLYKLEEQKAMEEAAKQPQAAQKLDIEKIARSMDDMAVSFAATMDRLSSRPTTTARLLPGMAKTIIQPAVSKFWEATVVLQDVDLKVVDLDDLLPPADRLITALRWIRMLQVVGRSLAGVVAMQAILRMREERNEKRLAARAKGTKGPVYDREVPYHPAIQLCYDGAAAGQEGVEFNREDMSKGSTVREDFQGFLRVQGRPGVSPSGVEGLSRRAANEAKAFYSGKTAKDPTGINSNAAGIGKVLQSTMEHCLKDAETGPVLGSFIARLDALFIVLMMFEAGVLVSLAVAPGFPGPTPRTFISSHLADEHLKKLKKKKSCLGDLLEMEDGVPLGFQPFRYLVEAFQRVAHTSVQ